MGLSRGLPPNNPSGRPRGAVGRVSNETRKVIALFMSSKYEEFEAAWDGLSGLEKVKTYISLVKYVMPVLASVKVEDSNGDDVLKKFLANQK